MKKIKILSVLSLLLLAACGAEQASELGSENTESQNASQQASPNQVSPAQAIENMLAKAEALRLQAAELEHEWSNHASTIAEAKKALVENNVAEAKVKAELAVRLGEQSIVQAEQSKNDWQSFMPSQTK